MQKFWSRLAVELGKRAGVVALVGLIITLTMGFGITRLKFATGTESYLNADEQVYRDSVRYQDKFGGEASLTVITMDAGHKVDELATNPANRSAIESTSTALRKVPGVRGVVDPLVALQLSQNLISKDPDHPTVENLLGSVAATSLLKAIEDAPEKDKAARTADNNITTGKVLAIPEAERVIGQPAWTDFLLRNNQKKIRASQLPVFPDDRHAMILTRFDGNMKVDPATKATNDAYDLITKLKLQNATARTTGAPKLLVEINDYLRGGMLQLGGIALAIMVLILLVLFNVRWRLLPLGVIVIGVIWAFGTAGYLGIPLTLVTVAGLPVMLGIGIDYAIQMHARVEEEAVIGRSDHPIQETARNLGPALLVVTFDAVFAFAALHWAKVPMLRDFGLLLAVGVAVICLASIIVPLATLGIREFRKPTPKGDYNEGWLGNLVVRLGGLPALAAIPLAIASLAIFAGGITVEKKLHIQADPVKWVNPSSQVIKNLRYAEREVGGSSELGVFAESKDVFTQPVVNHVDAFTNRYLTTHPKDVVVASSIVEIVSDLLVVPGTERVPPRADLVKAAYEASPADVKSSVYSSVDGSQSLNVVFLAAPGSLEDRKVFVQDIRDDQASANKPPAGLRVTPSGLVVVGVGLLDNLEKNRILLTYLSIAFVAAFLAIRMRSVVRSLLSLVPVLIAVGASSLVAYWAKLELSPMTAVGGPLVVAACTEFTSLILLRFVEERGRGLSPQEAVDVTAARTGRAFIVSAMTAIAGVAVISFSSMPLLRDFGRVVGMNVAIALLSALVVLPPMLVWADKWGLVSKGMIHHHEPFIDTPGAGVTAE
ncbi:MAG: MMPL family transporter [Acidimicrobiales bacterium]